MAKLSKQQYVAIAAAILIIVLLLLLPRKVLDKKDIVKDQLEEIDGSHNHDFTIQSLIGSIPDESLRNHIQSEYDKYLEKSSNISKLDSLYSISYTNNFPELAASFYELKALKLKSEESWLLSGDAFFNAFRYTQHQEFKTLLINKAIDAYNEVLKINDKNLNAKTGLGVCYVDGSSYLGEPPMRGITLLLEVVKEDSTNLSALTNLGYFSIQSGQYEKAKQRFEQILIIEPKFAEAHLYLTDISLAMEDTTKAVEHIEKYKNMIENPATKQQLDEYIKKLLNN